MRYWNITFLGYVRYFKLHGASDKNIEFFFTFKNAYVEGNIEELKLCSTHKQIKERYTTFTMHNIANLGYFLLSNYHISLRIFFLYYLDKIFELHKFYLSLIHICIPIKPTE